MMNSQHTIARPLTCLLVRLVPCSFFQGPLREGDAAPDVPLLVTEREPASEGKEQVSRDWRTWHFWSWVGSLVCRVAASRASHLSSSS